MENTHSHTSIQQPDFGTGQKKLGIYLFGLVSCIVLTLLAFWVVMANQLSKNEILAIIFIAACLQFLIQIICFLRLNVRTEQARINTMSIIFTLVILIVIVAASLWIMWSANYYMM